MVQALRGCAWECPLCKLTWAYFYARIWELWALGGFQEDFWETPDPAQVWVLFLWFPLNKPTWASSKELFCSDKASLSAPFAPICPNKTWAKREGHIDGEKGRKKIYRINIYRTKTQDTYFWCRNPLFKGFQRDFSTSKPFKSHCCLLKC